MAPARSRPDLDAAVVDDGAFVRLPEVDGVAIALFGGVEVRG